jgi:hypothetical protein
MMDHASGIRVRIALFPMNAWYIFWMANFVIAGSAFAVIATIVFVRGLKDLREMLANLRAESNKQ